MTAPVIRHTAAGWSWYCGLCRAGRGGYASETAAWDGLAEHDYGAGD